MTDIRNQMIADRDATIRQLKGQINDYLSHSAREREKVEADMAVLVALVERATKAMSPHYVNWLDDATNALTRIQGEYRCGEVGHE